MKILALEASATAASAAVCTEDRVIGEYFLDTAQTHSQTLLPMVEQLLAATQIPLEALEFLAVSTGPGSFTGLRIAISAVKGMAMGAQKPCVGVSTLEALAYNLRGFDGIIVPAMDARCGQVYTALFTFEGDTLRRLAPDEAISVQELGKMLSDFQKPLFLVGDGAELCYNILLESLPLLRLAPPHLRRQRAASVAAAAVHRYGEQGAVDCALLLPGYLRLPQAERELLQRQQDGKTE
ncbi:MAG: tRNA (adenosine(37)-N6)-threonylcarbamoyltransferase complex dimerization subunit type 1 TsaB [Angelakisella sp.]